MAVIITNMDMPKSCKECNLTYLDSGDDAYFGSTERRCVIDGSCIDGISERAYDCPLKSTDEIIKEIEDYKIMQNPTGYILNVIHKYCD
jgi:hypothetical protein